MQLANAPALLTLAPWLRRNDTPKAIVWISPTRQNRVETTVPNPIMDAEPADMTADHPIIAFAAARLRRGLTTGIRFATIRDGADGFLRLTKAAQEAAQ
jgi:hypothetical protein